MSFIGAEAAGWGDELAAGEAGEGESLPSGTVNLGGGSTMQFSPEAFRQLLHHPLVIEALKARGQAVADTANSLMAMDERAVARLAPDGQPAYTAELHENPYGTRPRVRVMPANMLGIVDDAHHSTLLKSLLANPSDPIGGGESEGGEGAEAEGGENEAEEAGGEE